MLTYVELQNIPVLENNRISNYYRCNGASTVMVFIKSMQCKENRAWHFCPKWRSPAKLTPFVIIYWLTIKYMEGTYQDIVNFRGMQHNYVVKEPWHITWNGTWIYWPFTITPKQRSHQASQLYTKTDISIPRRARLLWRGVTAKFQHDLGRSTHVH
jgi:hypothetical protein